MLNELNEKGFIHLLNRDEDQLQEILASLGKVIMTTDVVVNPESRGMITTASGLDLHTDHHKAKYIVWYCYRQTDLGGESILLDAEKAYEQLTESYKEELKSIELFEHKIFDDDKESYPLIATDSVGNRRFYYSFWLVKDENKDSKALIEFQRVIRAANIKQIRLEEKDILIVDNHRMFHGRTPIDGRKDRFLKRYWLAPNNENI